MNVLESAANSMGRAVGSYRKGINDAFRLSGARPLLGDDSAFIDPYAWGRALLEGHIPRTKQEFVDAFKSWVYICVKLNAQTVATVRSGIYVAKEKKGIKYRTIKTKAISKNHFKYLYLHSGLKSYFLKAEEIEEITEHVALDLMKEVNPWNNQRDLWETTIMFLDLTGEAYWYLPKNNLGVPSQIWTIPSQFINPKFGKSHDNPILYYIYKRGNNEVDIPVDEIIQFNYPNPNNSFTGFSPIKGVAEAVYIDSQMDAFETALFENRARPGGILTPKSNISRQDQERLQQQFEQKFKGSKRAGRTLVLPKDTGYERDTMTPEELNFGEGKYINMERICLALDVPPAALISKNINLANAKVADNRHAKNGILPRCRRLEEKINEKLMPRYDGKVFFAFDNPVPADRELELKEQTERIKSGILAINEARVELGLEPMEGGDVPHIDSRLIPLGTQPVVAEQAEEFGERVMDFVRRRLHG